MILKTVKIWPRFPTRLATDAQARQTPRRLFCSASRRLGGYEGPTVTKVPTYSPVPNSFPCVAWAERSTHAGGCRVCGLGSTGRRCCLLRACDWRCGHRGDPPGFWVHEDPVDVCKTNPSILLAKQINASLGKFTPHPTPTPPRCPLRAGNHVDCQAGSRYSSSVRCERRSFSKLPLTSQEARRKDHASRSIHR